MIIISLCICMYVCMLYVPLSDSHIARRALNVTSEENVTVADVGRMAIRCTPSENSASEKSTNNYETQPLVASKRVGL